MRVDAFKIQSHLMFFDTSHNSPRTVIESLRRAFAETARKMWAYLRCLPKTQQPKSGLITRMSLLSILHISPTHTQRYGLLLTQSRHDFESRRSCIFNSVQQVATAAISGVLLLYSKGPNQLVILVHKPIFCQELRIDLTYGSAAYGAFLEVLGKKQANYGPVIAWLKKQDKRRTAT